LAARDEPSFLSLLAKAHGSAVDAQHTLDRSLVRAGLDALPSSPSDLVTFVRIDVRAVVQADFGAMIADKLTEELCLQLCAVERSPSPRSCWAPRAPARSAIPKEAPALRHDLGKVGKSQGAQGRSTGVASKTRGAARRAPVDEEVTADLSQDPRREDS